MWAGEVIDRKKMGPGSGSYLIADLNFSCLATSNFFLYGVNLSAKHNGCLEIKSLTCRIAMEVETVKKAPRAPTAPLDPEEAARKKRIAEAEKAYGRGSKIKTRRVRDKKLRANLKRLESKYQDAALAAKDAEILHEQTSGFLEPEHELERTYKVRQDEIKASVALETAQKGFELKLGGLGPYSAEYTRNGRHLLFAGRKGHVMTSDWREGKQGCQLQLGETVRDAKWLHNELHFAVAQKKYVYIYDHNGMEVHKLAKHVEVLGMEFLPYHFLLASIVWLPVSYLRGPGLTISTGHVRRSTIHRHIHRPADSRDAHKTRRADCIRPESIQCHTSRWTLQWPSNPLVTKLHNPTS